MRHVQQTDKRQATLNQIYNSVEYARFGDVGTVGSFTTANNGISVTVTNTRDGCGGSTTLDVTVFEKDGNKTQKFFRNSDAAVEWLNAKLAPAPLEDERGHTYAPPAAARC